MRGAEQSLAKNGIGIHRTAHVHEHHELDAIAPGWRKNQLNLAGIAGAGIDRRIQIQFVRAIIPVESTKSSQR